MMSMSDGNKDRGWIQTQLTRRGFLKTGVAAGLGGLVSGCHPHRTAAAFRPTEAPNFVYIICDQLSLDAISAHGCPYVRTPNIDRLVASGVTFMNSHTTDPVCSPARSSLLTGRMPSETGVVSNGRPIADGISNIGEWLGAQGYETVYSGKWHLPDPRGLEIPGFTVLPSAPAKSFGAVGDRVISRSCEAFLRGRSGDRPFLLLASFVQPHDICLHATLVPASDAAVGYLGDRLPPLPPNYDAQPTAPRQIAALPFRGFSDAQWRYHRYIYFRQIEMLDAEVGRLLDALEDSNRKANTVVVFTSDHGEGAGRHRLLGKGNPYEEAVKVPLVVSCPGRMESGLRNDRHLVTGLDIVSTVCDYAGVDAPPGVHGLSLRPLLENRDTPWREFVVAEIRGTGRMLRTADCKYVHFPGDPVKQLFDMRNDPLETTNLYDRPKYAAVLDQHRKLLEEWEAGLAVIPPTPVGFGGGARRRRRLESETDAEL